MFQFFDWSFCVCWSLSVLWLKDFVCAEFFSQSTKAFELATVFQCFWLKLLCVPKSFSALTEGFWGRIFYGFSNSSSIFCTTDHSLAFFVRLVTYYTTIYSATPTKFDINYELHAEAAADRHTGRPCEATDGVSGSWLSPVAISKSLVRGPPWHSLDI